jgi:hypothetical protein
LLNASIVQGKGTMTELNSFDQFEKTFDIEDPAFAEQFEDVLEHLITKCPVAHSEVGPGYHVFNRYKGRATLRGGLAHLQQRGRLAAESTRGQPPDSARGLRSALSHRFCQVVEKKAKLTIGVESDPSSYVISYITLPLLPKAVVPLIVTTR